MDDKIEKNLVEFYLAFSKSYHESKASHENEYSFVRTSTHPWPNYVLGLKASALSLEKLETLNRQIENDYLPPFLVVKDVEDFPDFDGVASQLKFRKVIHWHGMAVSADEVKPMDGQVEGLSIKAITSRAELKEWLQVVNQALFDQEKLHGDVFNPLLNSSGYRFILAYYNGQPAGTALMFDHEDTCGIYLVAVLENFRKKGIGSAISHFIAEKNAKPWMVLHATKAGKRVYDKFGFKDYCTFDVVWKLGKFV